MAVWMFCRIALDQRRYAAGMQARNQLGTLGGVS